MQRESDSGPLKQRRFVALLLSLVGFVAQSGCGSSTPEAGQSRPSPQPARVSQGSAKGPTNPPIASKSIAPTAPAPKPQIVPLTLAEKVPPQPAPQQSEPPRTLKDLVDNKQFKPDPLPIDQQRLAARGIRKIEGRHVTLYTDLDPSKDVDELPDVFDLAVPQWCEYFEVPREEMEGWHLNGFLIKDREKFQEAGVFPDDLPPFVWGYQRGHEFWLFDQPSSYYRRHLFLHEGTHGFMNWHLGGTGPMWYTEGTAELLGTHRWQDGKLTLRHNPRDTKEVPYWGRIKVLREAYRNNSAKPIESIFFYRGRGQLPTEMYAWSWALCTFFDQHPATQARFRDLRKQARTQHDDFSKSFMTSLREHWPRLAEEWQLLVMNIDYGYDVARVAVKFKEEVDLPAEGGVVEIAADHGWQSTGFRLRAGTRYEITAAGEFQVNDQPRPWIAEPDGVTIEYFDGLPLGILVGAIRAADEPLVDGMTALARVARIGSRREFTAQSTGTLFLKVNDSPTDLANNSGSVQVTIKVIGS